MTWPFSTAASRAPGRLSGASWSRSANTVLSMNVSTSRPIECASSSATTNARGLTHKAHRRELLYRIARCLLQRPRHGLSRGVAGLQAWLGEISSTKLALVVAQSWHVDTRLVDGPRGVSDERAIDGIAQPGGPPHCCPRPRRPRFKGHGGRGFPRRRGGRPLIQCVARGRRECQHQPESGRSI